VPRLVEAADPALLLEDHAARDRVWHAVEQLSEPLRVVTLLRYFTGVKTYEQIGAVCGIPAGAAWLMWLDAGRVSRLRLFHEPHAHAA